uniref:Diacylglycerol O-acyltransferase n=1 Tax=Rhodosporidiobolus fluvialis TaxID=33190 RepID=A0A224AAI8_9BASI|nr:diacylgycerol acyltransferase isoform 2 [Rhodosporidiobolus fluvialis]
MIAQENGKDEEYTRSERTKIQSVHLSLFPFSPSSPPTPHSPALRPQRRQQAHLLTVQVRTLRGTTTPPTADLQRVRLDNRTPLDPRDLLRPLHVFRAAPSPRYGPSSSPTSSGSSASTRRPSEAVGLRGGSAGVGSGSGSQSTTPSGAHLSSSSLSAGRGEEGGTLTFFSSHVGVIDKQLDQEPPTFADASHFPRRPFLLPSQTADLPPTRRYIFGYHPHGVIGMGAIANFGTEATGFSRLFPGLKPHLLTLSSNFQLPLYREILLALGVCSVSMKSCQNILRQGPGSSITIVVGGAAESLSAHPGTADLTLKRRKGFIKLAIRQGADLVPVFSFGENDIFEQLSNSRGTRLYKAQKKFQALFGFTLRAYLPSSPRCQPVLTRLSPFTAIFFGRGLFNYNMGLMPYRHPIVSVGTTSPFAFLLLFADVSLPLSTAVGRPISVTQKDNPTNADLDEVQQRYITELKRIWEDYKEVYAKSRTKELNIIA